MNLSDRKYCIGRGLASVKGNPGVVETDFMKLLLETATDSLLRHAAGSTFPNLPGEKLAQLTVSIPPLNQQRHIVSILNEQLSAVEQARAAAKVQLEAARALAAAHSKQLFGSPEAREWARKQLSVATLRVSKGESPQWQGYSYVEQGARFVRSENVQWGSFQDEPQVYVPLEFHSKLERSKLQPGDVLVNLVGASIGRACVVPPGIGEANVNQAVCVVTPGPELLGAFLVLYLISQEAQEHFEKVQVEMARPNISLQIMRELSVPLPPLALQENVVTQVGRWDKASKGIIGGIESQLDEMIALSNSLIAEAFSGRL